MYQLSFLNIKISAVADFYSFIPAALVVVVVYYPTCIVGLCFALEAHYVTWL